MATSYLLNDYIDPPSELCWLLNLIKWLTNFEHTSNPIAFEHICIFGVHSWVRSTFNHLNMCPFKISSWTWCTYLIVDFKLGYVLVLGMPTLDSDWSIQYIPPATVGHLLPCLIPRRWLWREPSASLLGYGVPAPPRLQLLRRWGNLNIKNQPISFAVGDFNIISSKWYESSKGNYTLNLLFVQIALASQTWHMHQNL